MVVSGCTTGSSVGRKSYGDPPTTQATGPGKVLGIEEWLLPTLMELLDEAHGVALLRCLRAEADAGKIRRLFRQLLAAGGELARQVKRTGQK